jgi:RimJ/RimL family protein N-acetyltransferase
VIDGDELPRIDAERVVLRWLTERDVGALHRVFSNAEVMRYWSHPPFEDESAAERLLRDIHDLFRRQELFQWGIARREDDIVIGTCTLFNFHEESARAEIGFALGRDHWRRGYMSEALRALIAFAFDVLALRRLEADVDPRNTPSIRVLERLGFVREGHLRERWQVNGEVQDGLFYGLLCREWRR